MEKSMLAFVLILMVLGTCFFGVMASREYSSNAWPFAIIAAACALGLGLSRERT